MEKLKSPRDFSQLNNLNQLIDNGEELKKLQANILVYQQRYVESFFISFNELSDINNIQKYCFYYPEDKSIKFDIVKDIFINEKLTDQKLLLINHQDKIIYIIPSRYGCLKTETSGKIKQIFPLCLKQMSLLEKAKYYSFNLYSEHIRKSNNFLYYIIDWNIRQSYVVESGTRISTGGGGYYYTDTYTDYYSGSIELKFQFCLKTNKFLGLKNDGE